MPDGILTLESLNLVYGHRAWRIANAFLGNPHKVYTSRELCVIATYEREELEISLENLRCILWRLRKKKLPVITLHKGGGRNGGVSRYSLTRANQIEPRPDTLITKILKITAQCRSEEPISISYMASRLGTTRQSISSTVSQNRARLPSWFRSGYYGYWADPNG